MLLKRNQQRFLACLLAAALALLAMIPFVVTGVINSSHITIAKLVGSSGLFLDISGIIQLELSGAFESIMDKYGDAERFPKGPPSPTVRRAAPILKALVGMTDAEAREHIKAKGWKASVVPEPSIIQHFANFGGTNAGSFEVRCPGDREFFYYDDNAGRRAIGGHMTNEQAFEAAQEFLNSLTGEQDAED